MDAWNTPGPRGAGSRPRLALLGACGGVLVAAQAGVAAVGDVRQGHVAARVWTFLAFSAVAWAAFLAGLWLLCRIIQSGGRSRGPMIVILSAALAARLVLLSFSWPNLSDDIHRYVWEGMVQQSAIGLNPYLVKPAEAPVAVQATPEGRQVTHAPVASIYPPFTEHVFRLIYPLALTARGYRWALAAFDVGTLAVLAALLRARGRSPLWAAVYAWHPLVITEFSASGHFDSLGIFWMVLAVHLLTRRHGVVAWAALAASVWTKYIAAPLVLFFWPRTSKRSMVQSHRENGVGDHYHQGPRPHFPADPEPCRKWHALGLVVVTALLFRRYLPGGFSGLAADGAALVTGRPPPHASWRIFDGLRYFAGEYDSNAAFYYAAVGLTGERMTHDPMARTLVAGLFLLLLTALRVGRKDLVTAGLYGLGGMIVLNRVVHPWYATWLVPWLALLAAEGRDRWGLAVWLGFTAAVTTSYTVLIRYVPTMDAPKPTWFVPVWSMVLQFAPVLGLAAVKAVRSVRANLAPRDR